MKHLLLTFITLAMTLGVMAQDGRRLSLSAMTESMAFPFTRYGTIHPGAEFGYDLKENEKPKVIKSTTIYVGWYYHRKVENAFYLRAEAAWQFKVKDLISIDLYSGLGYMHVFYPGEVYELNSSSGDFEKINQTGRPHLLGNVGFGFTYIHSSSWQPFIRQDLGIETPFANGIPIMVHSFLKAGTHFRINKNK